MLKKIIFLNSLIIISLIVYGCSDNKSSDEAADEPRYLIFQLFTFNPGNTFLTSNIENSVDDIIKEIGIKGNGKRMLGFAIEPLTLDMSDEELRSQIRTAFEIADRKNVAVAFHIDDSMFWLNRKDLWQNPENVEWVDWQQTIHPNRWVDWAPIVLAPQMCYTSLDLRKEISRIAKDVIGAEIKEGLDNLKSKNKEHLFAGVIAGWETGIADYRYLDANDQQLIKIHGSDFPRERIGYCALSDLGFSANNPPKDFEAELEKVVKDWAAFWAQQINLAGIPSDKIYTHFAFPVLPEEKKDEVLINIGQNRGIEASILGLSRHVKASTAFNEFSRAGFSTYPADFKENGKDALLSVILEEVDKQGKPFWASVEGTNTRVESGITGITSSGLSWEEYLGGMFNSRAVLVTIFAWEEPQSPYGKATRSQEAIEAYKKFLRGENLAIDSQSEDNNGKHISIAKKVKLNKIPSNAEIVYHQNGFIYVMDSEGKNTQQITFENPKPWEHVAVSYDGNYVAANYHDNEGPSHSNLIVFDLKKSVEYQLVPNEFVGAGSGGIAWDSFGYIYFSANREEHIEYDIYKIKYDGMDLTRLRFTSQDEGTADVGVSRDGSLIAYVLAIPTEEITEIWVANSDGTNHRRVYKAGKVQIASAHDPEITDDNSKVIFSIYNTNVEPNFPEIEGLNTAHDLWSIDIGGNLDTLTRITKPGPISIIPNIKDDLIVYTEINGKRTEITGSLTNVPGDAAIVPIDCEECEGKIIKLGANTPKWIP